MCKDVFWVYAVTVIYGFNFIIANTGQEDTDGDGYGNICDADLDNDGVVGFQDFNAFRTCWLAQSSSSPNWQGQCENADLDSDGVVGFADFNLLRSRWLTSAPWQ
jgi:hypothetical protein